MGDKLLFQNKIHCILGDDGIIRGQKDGTQFSVTDLFQFSILLDGTKRRWVPKFWADHYEKDMEKYSGIKELDARIPLIIGLSEYYAYLTHDNHALADKIIHFVSDTVKKAASFRYSKVAKDFDEDFLTTYDCYEKTTKLLLDEVCPQITEDTYVDGLIYHKTKEPFHESREFVQYVSNILYILLKTDQDYHFFEDTMFQLTLYAISEALEIVNTIYFGHSSAMEKQKGEFLGNALQNFMEKNNMKNDALGGLALLSGASIEDSIENISIWNTELYSTNGYVKVINPDHKFYHYKKNSFIPSFCFSECTTACTMLFIRLMSCLCETFKIKNKMEVNWFDEDIDEIIASCLGTDDFGRFIKSGKLHYDDMSIIAIHGGDPSRSFITKSELINLATVRMYGSREEVKSEKPLEIKNNIPDFFYFNLLFLSELIQESCITAELIALKSVYKEVKNHNEELNALVETLEREVTEIKASSPNESELTKDYETEMDDLRGKVNQLEHVLNSKTEQISSLKEEIASLKKERPQVPKEKELSPEKEEKLPPIKEMIEWLNTKQIFFVGGRWDMLDRLAEKGLINASQINKESQKFDKPKNPDLICYMTKFMNHSMYYTVKNNFPQNAAMNYNGTNLDKMIEELYKFGKHIEESQSENTSSQLLRLL